MVTVRPAATDAAPTDGGEPGAVVAPPSSAAILLDSDAVARTVDRIAHQIIEGAGGAEPVLLGIPTRGVLLADRLAGRIGDFTGAPVPHGCLDITLYRDDLHRRPPRSLTRTVLPEGGVDDRLVVLVDDVLFSGRTVRAALDALREHGRPAVVRLVVLVDRGHRRLPIRADYVGKNIPTALGDDVAVRLRPRDGWDGVELVRA